MFINLAKKIIFVVIPRIFSTKTMFYKKINISKRQNDNQVNSFFKLIYNIFSIISNNKIHGILFVSWYNNNLQTEKSSFRFS
jgi:hypothetical protein